MSTRREFIKNVGLFSAGMSAIPKFSFGQTIDQVKIFYGFPAGSSGDSVARRVGEKLAGSAFTRNPAVVENKPGAGGRIADGSVLALAPVSALANYPFIYPKLSYEQKDFAPVSIGAIAHHGLAVGPLVPASVKTIKDFLAWAKANPGQANYGSPGAGSTPAMITPHGDFIANHKAGKLRLLATTGPARSPYVPDVATFAEQGFAELTTEEWFGFYAPAKTPASVIAAANSAINAALREKSVQDALANVGLIPHGSTVDAMTKWQQAETERWGPLIKRIGFTADS